MMRNVFIQEHAIDIVQLRATIAEEQCTFFQFSSSVLTFLDTPAAATLRCWGAVLLRVFRSAEPAQGVVVNACTAITAVPAQVDTSKCWPIAAMYGQKGRQAHDWEV